MKHQRLGRISRFPKAGPYRPEYVMGPKDKRLAAETVQRMPREMTLKDVYLQFLSKHYAFGGREAKSPKHLPAVKSGARPSYEQFLYWARMPSKGRLP
jgi:hypothetical protein